MEPLTDQERLQFEALKTEQPIEEEAPNGEEAKGQEGQDQALLEQPKDEPKKEEVKEPPKDETKQEKMVRLEALHEERARRKEVQKQLQEMQEKFARVDERLKILAQPKKEETAPDPNDDPLGYERYERQRLQREIEERAKADKDRSEKITSDMEALKYKTYIERQEMLFERQNPDYQEALKYLVDFRTSLLEEFGIEEDERQQAVQQELTQVVQLAMQRGKNPAEAVYKMAQKIGYKKPEKKEPEKKIEQLEKGMKAAGSLSTTGGKQATALTAEALAEMSDEEFQKLNFEDFRKVMGG